MLHIKKSIKIFKLYKCDFPSHTIRRIQDGFGRIGIKTEYSEHRISLGRISLYNGQVVDSLQTMHGNGKGQTRVLAKASAYAELAERYSVNVAEDVATLKSSKPRSRQDNVLNIEDLLKGKNINAENIKRGQKSVPLLCQLKKAINLRYMRECYVPICFVKSISGSNGVASGNTIEEAIVQALCEIIERHVVLRLVESQQPLPTISPHVLGDPVISDYIKLFHSLGRDIVIKDASLGEDYPAVAVVFKCASLKSTRNPYLKRFYRRFRVACDMNMRAALIRCFSEELQGYSRHEYIEGQFSLFESFWQHWAEKKSDIYPFDLDGDAKLMLMRKYDYFGETEFLEERGGKVSSSSLWRSCSYDAAEDLQNIANLLDKKGYSVFIVDHTHPQLAFPTVRVIVPSMSDIIGFMNPKWINENGLVPYEYGHDTNLHEYVHSDKWLRSKGRLTSLIELLEKRFAIYGCNEYFAVNGMIVQLFYFAYYLSLALDDWGRSLKYIKTIRGMNDRALYGRPEFSLAMQRYFELRTTGLSEENSLRAIRVLSGRGRACVKRALTMYQRSSFALGNPFRSGGKRCELQ